MTTITNYERGFNILSVDILEKLARYFGISIDYLLCYKIGLPTKNRKMMSHKKFCGYGELR